MMNAETVQMRVEDWLERRRPHLKPQTHAHYSRLIDTYIAPHIGHMALSNIQPIDVQLMTTAIASEAGFQVASRCDDLLRSACNTTR